MYHPERPSGQGTSNENVQDTYSHNSGCGFWFIQVLVWLSLIALIATIAAGSKDGIYATGIIFVIMYILYVSTNLASHTASYLKNKNRGDKMYETMLGYFSAAPNIEFNAECYHMEVHTYYTRRRKHKTTRRVVTHKENYVIPYYSFRDVSGYFVINFEGAEAKQKYYIKLQLDSEINFADPISIMDYEYQKECFWYKNRFRDQYMDFKEERRIPNLNKHNLIPLTEKEPVLMNTCCFTLAVFLTLAGPYKRLIDSYCITQSFRIRKLVSTRYDLNMQDYLNQHNYNYDYLRPGYAIQGQNYSYDPSQIGGTNSSMQVDLPTQEELEEAERKYNNLVPQYQYSSIGGIKAEGNVYNDGNYNSGNNGSANMNFIGNVIKPSQDYSHFNSNQCPDVFKNYDGSKKLEDEYVNDQGAAPADFPKLEIKNIPTSLNNNNNDINNNDGYNFASTDERPMNFDEKVNLQKSGNKKNKHEFESERKIIKEEKHE